MHEDRDIQPIHLSDRLTVQTIRGFKGNIIGQLPDGRAVLVVAGPAVNRHAS